MKTKVAQICCLTDEGYSNGRYIYVNIGIPKYTKVLRDAIVNNKNRIYATMRSVEKS